MASKRIKPKAPEPFKTREEFAAAVDEIARLDIDIKKLEANLKKLHQNLDEKHSPEIKEKEKRLQDLMARAEPFFAANATALCKPGQREGETGLARYGVRKGLPTVIKTVTAAWKKLAEMFFESDTLRRFTRATPEVDKEKILAAWRDAESGDDAISAPAAQAKAELKARGIDVAQDDAFWVEAKAEAQV